MRRQRAISICWILLGLLAITMVSIAVGQEKARTEEAKGSDQMAVVRATVGTGVENLEPVGVADLFPATTEKVYCFVEIVHIPSDQEITFVWLQGDKEIHKLSLPVTPGPRWRTFAYKNVGGLKGNWKVEIKDTGGKLLKDVRFKVE